MKKALIIDANNMLYKAYYATMYQGVSLHSLEGIPTNALYAFIRMITRFLNSNHYDALFVAFDAGKTTFRTAKLVSYKATRQKTPDELLIQFDLIKKFLDLAEISWCQTENYEADDLIGTVVKNTAAKNYQIDIISSDKDLYQLLDDNIKILIPQKGLSEIKEFTVKNLKLEYSLDPRQIPDYKGLMGDNSDNLPGIKGIGPKTAIKLLQKYGSLEAIIANKSDLTEKEEKLITNNAENGILTKSLATIDLDTPMPVNLDNCLYNKTKLQSEKLQSFFHKYDMKSLIIEKKQTLIVKDSQIKKVNQWSETYNANKNFIWVEVCWENYHLDPIIAISIKNENGTFYVPYDVIAKDESFKYFLVSKKYQKITWDIKKTIIAINNNFKINADGFIFDLMLASYLLYASEKITPENVIRLLNIDHNHNFDDISFYGKGVKRSIPEASDKIMFYLELKLLFLETCYPIILEKLKENNNLELYEKIELPAVYPLITMENNGILIDKEELQKMASSVSEKLKNLEIKISEYAGKDINPNSPKQMSHFLFEELKLPKNKKNSTAYEVLLTLKNSHPIIEILIDYRKLQKLYTSYLIGLQRYIMPDGKIHTIYNQVQTSTGRLSSSEPNMQNITIRDETQRELRKVFIASSNNTKIVSFDYSQIELRLLAHISGDKNLIKAFHDNKDIHADTASQVLNIGLEKITKEQRSKAKAVNFGIIYGISSYGLSQQLNIKRNEAQEFIDKYFHVYPQIKDYIKNTIAFCEKNGYVETLYHRRRLVPEIYNNNKSIKEFGERIAMNMPIQGTAADIIKLAMISVDQAIKTNKLHAKLLAQVHDELIFEINEKDLKESVAIISKIMNNVIKLKVPLIVNNAFGNNWYDLK